MFSNLLLGSKLLTDDGLDRDLRGVCVFLLCSGSMIVLYIYICELPLLLLPCTEDCASKALCFVVGSLT